MRVLAGTILSLTLLFPAASAQAQEQPKPQPKSQPQAQPQPLAFARVYADATGASHFADENMPLTPVTPGPGIPPTPASAPSAATGLVFVCPPAGGFADWHVAPHRQYNVVLSGEVEVEVSDGETRRFGPGSVLLAEDTTGQGTRTRVVSKDRACFVGVALAEQ
jgi:hypothetical protein